MQDNRASRSASLQHYWFGATALTVLAGLVIQAGSTWNAPVTHWSSSTVQVLNMLFYFTILSNIITGVTTGMLYFNPNRTTTLFRTIWLCGLLGISVTGVIYHVAISGTHHPTGWAWVANAILHYVVPAMAFFGWLVVGPRGFISPLTVKLSILFPLIYCAVTLIRGPVVNWYPYAFVDVDAHGYGRVAVNCVVIAVFVVALAAAFYYIDRWLARRTPSTYALSAR